MAHALRPMRLRCVRESGEDVTSVADIKCAGMVAKAFENGKVVGAASRQAEIDELQKRIYMPTQSFDDGWKAGRADLEGAFKIMQKRAEAAEAKLATAVAKLEKICSGDYMMAPEKEAAEALAQIEAAKKDGAT